MRDCVDVVVVVVINSLFVVVCVSILCLSKQMIYQLCMDFSLILIV